MSTAELLVSHCNGVATLTFNRPAARNAMNPAMRDALLEALDAIDCDTTIEVVVLRGNGGNFIAGGDLQAFAETLELDREARRKNFSDRVKVSSALVERLINFSRPIIAVIEGAAAGAGISISQCCDFVIANRSARLSFAHVHVGLALDLGLSYFLPRAAGTLAAKRMAMLGARISAEEALALGLVTTLVEDEQVEAELETLLGTLAKMPSAALASIKREFRDGPSKSLQEHLALEAEMVADCAATEDFERRVAAFVAR